MTNKKKTFKSPSLVTDKFEDPVPVPVKLTKQQKRDLKRNQNASATAKFSKSTPNPTTSSSSSSTIASDEPVKLTKQQKRDLKRNALSLAQGEAKRSQGSTSKSAHTISRPTDPPTTRCSVYKRKATYPPLYLTDDLKSSFPTIPQNRFLSESDASYSSVIATAYQGFNHSPTDTFSTLFHDKFEQAMVGLETEGKYQYDVTQPAGLGTKTAMTYVTRCVVGEAGTTYKYLGLRMFSIPWTPGSVGCSEHSVEIGRLNEEMIKRSEVLLAERNGNGKGSEESGSCQYNLTLINRCFPMQHSMIDLKDEPIFKQDKCTVSWHADSTLEHFSTIGVYHVTRPADTDTDTDTGTANTSTTTATTTTTTNNNSNIMDGKSEAAYSTTPARDSSWRIAMRVHYDAEGPNVGKAVSRAAEMKDLDESGAAIPPVVFALPNKSAYFMLDDFNHHHQHSVMVGDTHRYASTHRVCRTDGHTFQSIKAQCTNILQQRVLYTEKYLRALIHTANTVEFEWIRQYYVQGAKHRETHVYWEGAMRELVEMWQAMSEKTVLALGVLRDAAAGSCVQLETMSAAAAAAVTAGDGYGDGHCTSNANRVKKQKAKQLKRMETVESASFSIVHQLLEERVQKRKDWLVRQTDAIFTKLPLEFRPQNPPLPPHDTAAEEVVLVPCKADGTVCAEDSTVADRKAGAGGAAAGGGGGSDSGSMMPLNIARVIDMRLILRWQALFEDRLEPA